MCKLIFKHKLNPNNANKNGNLHLQEYKYIYKRNNFCSIFKWFLNSVNMNQKGFTFTGNVYKFDF